VIRKPVILGIAAVGILLLAGGAAYAYFFSGLRTTPQPLALSSPSPVASGAPAAAATDLNGRWVVGQGSKAGYRVKEQFVGQTSPHEAVARTTSVSGGLSVQQAAGAIQASGLRVAVDLSQLKSEDQVAGYNVTNRDRLVSQSLSVFQYPQAVFQAQSITVPAALTAGQAVDLSVPGQMAIHGTSKDVTATVHLQLSGNQVQAAGSIPANMGDFGVAAPQVPFSKVDSQVTIDFLLVLVKSAA
jgi:polyisoprenoid-binding protein YceI